MSNLQRYIDQAAVVTGTKRTLTRVDHLVGDEDTLLGSESLADYARSEEERIRFGIGTAAGAVAGGIIGIKYGHPIVGALSGASVFTNVPAVLNGNTRKEALWNMAQTHGGVAVSLAMPNNRALGFVLGYLAVGAVRYYYGDDQ